MLAIISILIVLIPLVIIHELGHFFAGKSVGVTILEFGIGFPPRAATLFTKGDTIYTINWLPLGGFVRPYGEGYATPKTQEEMKADLEEIEGRQIKNPKGLFAAGPWERIWFMAAGPLANFIAAYVLFILVAVVGQPEQVEIGVVVDSVKEGSVAQVAGLQANDYITHVNGTRTLSAEEFASLTSASTEANTLTVDRDGEIFDLTVQPQLAEGEAGLTRPVILEIADNSPAKDVKLKVNDVFLAIDGVEVYTTQDIIDNTVDREGDNVVYTIQRGTEIIDVTIKPRYLDGSGDAKIGVTISALNLNLGIATRQAYDEPIRRASSLGDAISKGNDSFMTTMKLTVGFPVMLIRGQLSLEQARPASIVTIGRIGGEIIRESQERNAIYPILAFGAIISIALAVTNLLPIPGLDGGRILFVIIELLRGKPMEPEREGFVHMLGILFLLSLMAVIIVLDVVKPFDLSSF